MSKLMMPIYVCLSDNENQRHLCNSISGFQSSSLNELNRNAMDHISNFQFRVRHAVLKVKTPHGV